MKAHLAAIAAVLLILGATPANTPDDAHPNWKKGAMPSCEAACRKTHNVAAKHAKADVTVIDVEKCDRVECVCGNGRSVVTNLADGAFCIRYLIVTPPPKAMHGKCARGYCQI